MLKRSAKTTWTDDRLQRLYAHYNDRFWSGKLPTYRALIKPRSEDDARTWIGVTDHSDRVVIVDVKQHTSDRSMRETLLHEMCHVAAGPKAKGIGGHGVAFFTHLERLLRRKAVITIAFPEAGGTLYAVDQVPSRFRLCRRVMRRAIDKHQREAENEIRKTPPPLQDLPWDDRNILNEFEDVAALHGITWHAALLSIGRSYGLLDIDAKPLRRAVALLKMARAAHRRGMRYWHKNSKAHLTRRATVAEIFEDEDL